MYYLNITKEHKEIFNMSIIRIFKKAIWIAFATALVASIFYAGYWVANIKNNSQQIKSLKENTVTIQIWEQTDKKIDGIDKNVKSLTENIEKIGNHITQVEKVNTDKIYIVEKNLALQEQKLDFHIDKGEK